ncbi:vacuolar protein sorting-associated protein 11 homolog isoform X2 [Galleria mellonella]|uniref:Vacuolar protein sorting-associated protein 11 homolog n=1 Tax=Galleria mellonella TaxID=7137 RepID=A0ABM3MI96_GALME|nr:vacuolar protein sorting-associated protein 11 homolog isoform X2 [Galleria mellonella]
MAFLEWRKFTFFDIHEKVDNGKIAECLQDTHVTVSTSGNGHVILGDVTGWAHIITRCWEITSFKAYELTISLAQQLPHDPFLVTVGDDEAGVNPLIKVWDWSRTDRHGNPKCVRVCRAVPSHMRPTPATALAVHENKNLLAVGFQDGSVSLFRGNLTRQRNSEMKTLPNSGNSPITGLAFKGADKLYVVSRASVALWWPAAERCLQLERHGAPPACSALSDSHGLTVAVGNAIYCYTPEGRGPCYALEGDKVGLNWFRSYLVITSNETQSKSVASTSTEPKSHHVTILDIQNKFIVFSKTFDLIDAVITEWGSFYILTKKKEIIYLEEKDLQSKLSLLFKKNLYDVAIRIASSQHYDVEGFTEINKQYGDHLYSKGDLKGAIDQYIKTIGWLDTSYVIRKYLEARDLEPLVLYLEELHKKGCATEDHTTLLLTCYVKIDQHDHQGKLKDFINSKDRTIDFDVDVAIKVVRQVSVDDALSLAANNKRHDWYLKIMLEDKKDYRSALQYMLDLEFEDAEFYMKKYGHTLIQHEPEESTKFLKSLCTDYKPRSKPLVDETTLTGGIRDPDRAIPDDFIHMFLSNSERLIEFLEHMTTVDSKCSKLVYNALIEHYIHVWAKVSGNDKTMYEEKVLKILKDSDANYDKDQTLIICQMLGFKAGILYLYEENKLWRAQVALHMRAAQAEEALGVCRRRGAACPRLWLDVLWWPPPRPALPELLAVIDNEKLLSPILVIDCLASTPSYTLGDVRKYLMNVLKSENDVITREQELAAKYKAESENMKAQIQNLQNEPITFQSSRCAICSKSLELPTVHFFCQHSFHQDCFQGYSESERECTMCEAARRRQAPPPPPPPADALHQRLARERDPYAVVSEYYGRGLFNKLTLVTGALQESPSQPAAPAPAAAAASASASAHAPAPCLLPPAAAAAPTYGPGAEAKLRLQEGQSKQVFVANTAKQVPAKGTTVVPIPEGRMRLLEQQRYSSSLEAHMNKFEPKVHVPRSSPFESPKSSNKVEEAISAGTSPKISAAINNTGKNPFEEEYDESKNPFANDEDEVINDPTNPFSEDNDYDKNLNPFS